MGIECRDCLFYDKKDDYCNDKLINNEFIAKAEEEFINQVDWSKVAVDTKILVRDYENSNWTKRYFAKYENGKVEAWCNGRTSWIDADTNYWNYAKLYVEGEDNE